MRIIFLNTWHGKVGDKLFDFLLNESKLTDIFCLSEVDLGLSEKFKKLFKNYQSIYDRGIKTDYLGGVTEGRNMFVKNGMKVLSSGSRSVYRVTKADAGGFQFAELLVQGKKFNLGSVHGKARPGHKFDTESRINQSKRIIGYFKDKKGPVVIGGDFNLLPDTKSVEMFEKSGYRNLIKDFRIKNTRNKLSWDQFGQKTDFEKQYFADYCFVSPEIKVKSFEVPYIEVSDHLPLILEFDLSPHQ